MGGGRWGCPGGASPGGGFFVRCPQPALGSAWPRVRLLREGGARALVLMGVSAVTGAVPALGVFADRCGGRGSSGAARPQAAPGSRAPPGVVALHRFWLDPVAGSAPGVWLPWAFPGAVCSWPRLRPKAAPAGCVRRLAGGCSRQAGGLRGSSAQRRRRRRAPRPRRRECFQCEVALGAPRDGVLLAAAAARGGPGRSRGELAVGCARQAGGLHVPLPQQRGWQSPRAVRPWRLLQLGRVPAGGQSGLAVGGGRQAGGLRVHSPQRR